VSGSMRGIGSARQARSAGSSADAVEDGSHGASLLYLRTMPAILWFTCVARKCQQNFLEATIQ